MKLIFLDIDGVLNNHAKLASNYCGIQADKVENLNALLAAVPDAQLVISSAWRYLVLNGSMTLKGFERLLLTHGVACEDRLRGTTAADPEVKGRGHKEPFDVEWWKASGMKWRAAQIRAYLDDLQTIGHKPPAVESYVVLDDLPLAVPNLVQTDEKIGLTSRHAARAIAMLRGESPDCACGSVTVRAGTFYKCLHCGEVVGAL